MTDIRFHIPPGTPTATCKGCGEFIKWILTKNGKNMPVDADGKPHWATCKKADQFRRRPEVIIALPKFLPLLNDLRGFLDDIEAAGDAEGHSFVERLLLQKENNQLTQITQQQFEWLERLHKEHAE